MGDAIRDVVEIDGGSDVPFATALWKIRGTHAVEPEDCLTSYEGRRMLKPSKLQPAKTKLVIRRETLALTRDQLAKIAGGSAECHASAVCAPFD